jgi:hypothetical protein
LLVNWSEKLVISKAKKEKFASDLENVEKSKKLKDIYRNYLTIEYILQFLLCPTIILMSSFHFFPNSGGSPATHLFIITLLFFVLVSIGPTMIVSRLVIILIRNIFHFRTNFYYYDSFSSTPNASFSTKMVSARFVNLGNKIAYVTTALYVLLFVFLSIFL